jgi:tetratricopeptide (TPR) repeat protein
VSTDVFISYAHAGGAIEHIRALAKLMTADGLSVFLDERTIPYGSAFPHDIADALLDARQVIVFIDSVYFTRPWCVYEMQVITAPYRAAISPADDLLEYVTVVLLGEDDVTALTAHLPPPLAKASWPAVSQTDAIVDLVKSRKQTCTESLGTRLSAVNDDAVKRLRSGGDIPLAWAPTESTSAPTLPANRPWHLELMPETRAEEFIGRAADLWLVFHHLVTCRAFNRVRSCCIQGAGGSGKSQLAAEFVARYGSRFFPGGVVWVNAAADLPELVMQFREIFTRMLPGQQDPAQGVTDPEQQRELLAHALATHCDSWPHSRQMLWIIDDVPEPAAGDHAKQLSHWCPALRDVNLLITSRRTGIGKMEAYVNIGGLVLNDAVEWLTRPEVDRRWLKDTEWEDLARWVGSLPLAIVLLRTSLMDGYTTTQALQLAQHQEPSLMLDKEMAVLRGEVDDDRLRGVTEAFDFSYQVLAKDPALKHAAHLAACLAPYPLADYLLADLIGTSLMGKLVKRSWLQRSAGEGPDHNQRYYLMHRIPASFLRSRMTEPQSVFSELFEWLGRVTEDIARKNDVSALGHHLMVIQREFRSLIDTLPTDDPLIRVARDFAVRASSSLTDPETRGYCYLAAGLANYLGAGDEVAERLTQLYDSGDQDVAAAIPHVLQALPGSGKASALMARLLEDSSWSVSYQAIIYAGQLMDLDLATPLLDAIMHTSMESPEPFYDVYLQNECPLLRTLLSDIVRYLNEGTATQRARAASLLGRVLMHNDHDLKAGGWTSQHLVGGLLRVAREDGVSEVVEAAVSAAATYFDAESYAGLVGALSEATDDDQRARLLEVMGGYLSATRRPTAPKILEQKFHDEGGVTFEIDLGHQKDDLPEGVYAPLIEVACGENEQLGRIATAGIMQTNSGLRALGDAAHQLIDQQAYDTVQLLSTRAITQDPEFTNANWWRGQVRLESGDATGALADFERVLEKTSDFIDANYWRGRARELLGDTQGAMEDYTRVIETDPEFFHAYYYRGLLRREMQDIDGAIADLAEVVVRTTDWQDAYYQHGVLLCQRQSFAEALPSLQHAAELAPVDFYAHHMLAFCLYNLQRYDEAEPAASRAIDINPDVAETWFFRGAARYGSGKVKEALMDLRRAIQLDPDDDRISQFKAKLEEYGGGNRG